LRRAAVFGVLLALAAAGAAQATSKADLAAVRETSSLETSGARTLQHTVRVRSTPAVVWQALTYPPSYRVWVASASAIDLKVGGRVDVAFDPKAAPGDPPDLSQEITAYVPERMIAFRNLKSPPLPGVGVYGRLAIVMLLTPVGDGETEVSLSQVGYGAGADFDALYGFFRSHNPEYLADLKAYAEKPAR